jgi:hypothetical protein
MRVSSLAFQGATRGGESVRERKDHWSNQKVRIFGADRMPIHTVGCDGDFRYQICAGKCDSLGRKSTKRYATDHPILFADLPAVQKIVGTHLPRLLSQLSPPVAPEILLPEPARYPSTLWPMYLLRDVGRGAQGSSCRG